MKNEEKINLFEQTETEKVVEYMNTRFNENLTARGIVAFSVFEVLLGTLMVNFVDDKGPYSLLVPLGLMMILLGFFGVLMWKGDVVRQGLREKALAEMKMRGHDKP